MAESKKRGTILIVDDMMINRSMLKALLKPRYDTLEAVNGQEALEVLEKDGGRINAILLDVMMPVMDGYAFMNELKKTRYAELPVIVLTGSNGSEAENRALSMGAWDFISKPYQPVILLSRLENAIARSQIGSYEKIKFTAEHDALTGLLNRNQFFVETRELLTEFPERSFSMVRMDIDHFSLLNSFWGEKSGDAFLIYLANGIRAICDELECAVCGRISADIFCACIAGEDDVRRFTEEGKQLAVSYNRDYFVKPSFGIYQIEGRSETAESIYECAAMAAKTCKGKYDAYIGYFSKSMREALFRRQTIINEMQTALDEGQFVPYFQPKYDLATDRPFGAETLVRWMHPTRGMISPGEFIPIFEQNGFIGKLDYFMWDTVCRLLRKWVDSGYDPAPVSVNISRANMYNPNIVSILCDLVKKYGLPASLLNLELTETAYMDNPAVMKEIVRKLQKAGFVVMMDDFGSGYSSLNTLKEIPVDILKVDMNFLQGSDENGRSEKILTSVIRMAGWLNLPVIVEGVETKEETDFLRSIGCGFIQGFYFAKPMPLEKYEKMIRGLDSLQAELSRDRKSEELNSAIWTASPDIEFIFNHILQPMAIFEVGADICSALRMNDAFIEMFGYGEQTLAADRATGIFSERHTAEELKRRLAEVGKNERAAKFACVVPDCSGNKVPVLLVLDYLGKIENRTIVIVILIEQK